MLENEAPKVVQLVANRTRHFIHIGMLSYRSEEFVSTFSRSLIGSVATASMGDKLLECPSSRNPTRSSQIRIYGPRIAWLDVFEIDETDRSIFIPCIHRVSGLLSFSATALIDRTVIDPTVTNAMQNSLFTRALKFVVGRSFDEGIISQFPAYEVIEGDLVLTPAE